jgi:hypothetical protein
MMPEKEFWRCTPRKLNSLLAVHAVVNGGKDEDLNRGEQPKYIDEVLPFF